MSIQSIIAAFKAVEQASRQASEAVLADWSQDAERLMQQIAPLDANDQPGDWHVDAVQSTADGATVDLIYSDPLGVLSTEDLQFSSEDLQTVTSAQATLGPDLADRLKAQVWS